MVAIFVLALFLTIIAVDFLVLRFQGKYHPAFEPLFSPYDLLMFDKTNFLIPPDMFFSKGHVWLKRNGDGLFDIGLDTLGTTILGSNPELNFALVGKELKRGDILLQCGSGNNKINFLSPVNGTVKAVNKNIIEAKKSDAYSTWGIRISSNDKVKNGKLFLSGEQAMRWMKKEFVKLNGFLEIHSPQIESAGATMLDGGLLYGETVSSIVYHNADDFEKEFLSI